MDHLVNLLRQQAKQIPNKLAYTFLREGLHEEGILSYSELDYKARQGAVFIKQFVAEGDRVLLLYPPGIDFIIGFFSCLYAGAIAIPAPPPDAARLKRTLPRLKSIIKDATANLIISRQQWLDSFDQDALDDFPETDWQAYENLSTGLADQWQLPKIQPESVAYLQYTSGSTSAPKGVMISHANVIHNLMLLQKALGYDEQSISVIWTPHFHDYGLVDGLLEPLYNGTPCYILSPLTFLKRPLRWLEAISRYQGTHTQGPNFAYDYCLKKISDQQKQRLNLSSLKVASNGSEHVREETLNNFCQQFSMCGFNHSSFYPAYGLAEATLFVTTKPLGKRILSHQLTPEQQKKNQLQRKIISCGTTLGHADLRIVCPQSHQQCKNDEIGEIWIKNNSVAQGYWNNKQATEKTFHAYIKGGIKKQGPYLRTSDLGFIKDGELYITGRLNDLIIMEGVNYYSQDIEWTVINADKHLRPEHAAVFSIDLEAREQLVIIVELAKKTETFEPIIQAIKQAVFHYHELAVYAIVLLKKGTLLKTSSGKLQRSACKTAFLNEQLVYHTLWKKPSFSRNENKKDTLFSFLKSALAHRLEISEQQIDSQAPFAHYGLSSRLAVSLVADIEDFLNNNINLSPTLFWQYNTLQKMVDFLAGHPQKVIQHSYHKQEAIAIIGMGCRFPQSNNPEQFWELLATGKNAVQKIPTTRFSTDALTAPYAGLIDHIDQFDAAFFGLSARESKAMDPQQRLLLEVVWEALEYANIVPKHLAGTQTGVFVGISTDDYSAWQFNQQNDISEYAGTGKAFSIAANRLSYLLDIKGPSLAIDTACSSSLVAIHQACQSLRCQESSLAIAAGVNLILSPQLITYLDKAQLLSAEGLCKTFSDQAEGYVRGEGVGAVILKPLAQAEQEGDRILAVIRSSVVNQNGRSNGLTAPHMQAQQALIESALQAAQIKAEEIGYLEAQGVGSSLGDSIEMDALKAVFKDNSDLKIGSVKTNIGHLEAASGMASLIKVVLSMQHQIIPQHLHLHRLNPLIDLKDSGLSIPTKAQIWTKKPYIAGVSAFGFGGTNAHLIISAGTDLSATEEKQEKDILQLFVLSAQTAKALQALIQRYVDYLTKNNHISLKQLAYSVFQARNHFTYRMALIVGSINELQQQLKRADQQIVQGSLDNQVSKDNNRLLENYFSGLQQGQSANQQMLETIKKLYLRGIHVDKWQNVGVQTTPLLYGLPHYPFQRQSYWLDNTPVFAQSSVDYSKANNKEVKPLLDDGFLHQLIIKERFERRLFLENYLLSKVQSILGINVSIQPRQRLFDLGIDSMMAVELKTHLEKNLKQPLTSTLLFDYPTLEELSLYLRETILVDLFLEESTTESASEQDDIVELLAQALNNTANE